MRFKINLKKKKKTLRDKIIFAVGIHEWSVSSDETSRWTDGSPTSSALRPISRGSWTQFPGHDGPRCAHRL